MEKPKRSFDREAVDYDYNIRRLIPYYAELHEAIINAIPFLKDQRIRVLDLGIGTGELALKVLETFTNSHVVGVDISPQMIGIAKRKLAKYEDRLSFLQEDFVNLDFHEEFDVIVSTFAIHHLDDGEKRRLYRRAYDFLKGRGCFFNGDIIKFKSEATMRLYDERWRSYMLEQGLTPEEVEYNFQKYLTEDRPTSLGDQISWLREAGFHQVECPIRYYNYAVFGGYKWVPEKVSIVGEDREVEDLIRESEREKKYRKDGHYSKVDYQSVEGNRVVNYVYDNSQGKWVNHEEILRSELTFFDMIFIKLASKRPTPQERDLLHTVLVSVSMGTGPHPPSVWAPKLVASTTKDERFAVINGIIAGIATIGTHHLGAVYDVMKLYQDIASRIGEGGDVSAAVKDCVDEKLESGEVLGGYGHPVYDVDPRNQIIKDMVRGINAESLPLKIYEALEEELHKRKGIHPNIDAAQALAYLVLGFEPVHSIYLTFLGRSLDMICHIVEELPRKPFSFLMEASPVDRFFKG
ncbi:MAG: citrate/2-methylcitrate synthase [bacterium]